MTLVIGVEKPATCSDGHIIPGRPLFYRNDITCTAIHVDADIIAAAICAFHNESRSRSSDVIDVADTFAPGNTNSFSLTYIRHSPVILLAPGVLQPDPVRTNLDRLGKGLRD
ncbi:hypothetical protein LJR231_001011 [Phyllobacterium sp. LjRoot231]|uniref:hypothetical protein n=1 Tax=Phyllobacterium sp. LjRoot231 TaxID=3342289 RepID=UPI003ECF1BC1